MKQKNTGQHPASRGVIKRYVELLAYALLGAALLGATTGWWIGGVLSLWEWLLSPTRAPLIALGFSVLLVSLARASRSFRGFIGLPHLLRFPPLWCASVFGFMLLLSYWGGYEGACSPQRPNTFNVWTAEGSEQVWCSALGSSGVLRLYLLGALGLLPGCVFSSLMWRRWASRARARLFHREEHAFESAPARRQDLLEWVQSDQPIGSQAEDQFGLNAIANRMAHRIQTADHPMSSAVVGDLGSGKTSLGRLVEAQLNSTGNVRWVEVSLWHCATAQAAEERILEELVEALTADVFDMEMLLTPRRYSWAVGFGKNWTRALVSPPSASSVLRRLGEVTGTLQLKLILWLDDLERMDGGSDWRNLISALLVELDKCGIGVIAATTSQALAATPVSLPRSATPAPENPQSDASSAGPQLPGSGMLERAKVFRTVEHIPRPTADQVRQCLKLIHVGVLGAQSETQAGRTKWQLNLDGKAPRAILSAEAPRDPVDALCTLLANPRALKMTLRDWPRVVSNLRGELNMDDALVACALRHIAFDVFLLVGEALSDSISSAVKESPRRQRLEAQLAARPDKAQLKPLVRFLLPGADEWRESERHKPQGLASSGRDYWGRFLSEEVPPGEEDQVIISALDQLHLGKPEAFAQLMAVREEAEAPRVFGMGLSWKEYLTLLERWWRVEVNQPPPAPDYWENVPSVVRMWNLALQQVRHLKGDRASLLEGLRHLTENTPPSHWFQLERVHYYFGAKRREHFELEVFDDTQRQALRQALLDWIEHYFLAPKDGAQLLARALETAGTFTTIKSSWGYDVLAGIAPYDLPEGMPFPKWPQFAARLLEAAEESPRSVLPALAQFIARSRPGALRGRESGDALYFRDRAIELFRAEGEERILNLFQKFPPAHGTEQEQLLYSCIRAAANDAAVRSGAPFSLAET